MLTQEWQSERLEDDIDIRVHLETLVRRRRLVCTSSLVALLVLGLAVLLYPAPFEATAGVAIVRTRTDVVFDASIKTLSGDTAGNSIVQPSEAHRNALLGLVQNGAIAEKVISALGDRLEPAQRNPAALMEKVTAEAPQKGNLIAIKVRDDDPQRAAAIANMWAEEFEHSANGIFAGETAGYQLSVQTELSRTQAAYEQAQGSLEQFVAVSREEELLRRIEEVGTLISATTHARGNAQVAAILQTTDASVKALTGYYESKRRVASLLEDARAMLAQVRCGGTGAASSNALALQLMKTEAFALSAPLPGQLQVQAGSPNGASADPLAQSRDLESLIAALEQREDVLDASIADLSSRLALGGAQSFVTSTLATSPTSAVEVALAGHRERLRSLSAQLEQEQANRRELTLARDQAWQTYKTLSSKASEVKVAAAVTGQEVSFAARAVAPVRRTTSGRSVAVLAAGIVGLLVGIVAALAVEWAAGDRPVSDLPWGGPGTPWNRAFRWIMAEARWPARRRAVRPGSPDR